MKNKYMTLVIKRSNDKTSMDEILGALPITRKFTAHKYSGVLNLKPSPLVIQKAMRNEWE